MKVGKNSLSFENVYLGDTSTVVGPREAKGPLRDFFDDVYIDLYAGQKTWEKAEGAFMEKAMQNVLEKNLDVDFVIAGDLINQNIISNYVMRNIEIPFIGIYSACSSMVLSMIVAANILELNNARKIISSVSSHYCGAEKQFRNPTEYGGAKPKSATSTVTGAVAALITRHKTIIKIKKATIGTVIDPKESDPNDMGSAMAPAAAETIRQHLEDFKLKPDYYDIILTGDLSSIGTPIMLDILKLYKIKLKNHQDAGLLIYDLNKQKVFSGGSGCACIGVVSMSYIKQKLEKREIKRVLLVATGALLNADILKQKETIPCIAHAISLEVEE